MHPERDRGSRHDSGAGAHAYLLKLEHGASQVGQELVAGGISLGVLQGASVIARAISHFNFAVPS